MKQDYLKVVLGMLSGCLLMPEDKFDKEMDIIAIPGFDSVCFEALMVQIEEFLQKDIDPEAIIQIKTIEDLARYVEQQHHC